MRRASEESDSAEALQQRAAGHGPSPDLLKCGNDMFRYRQSCCGCCYGFVEVVFAADADVVVVVGVVFVVVVVVDVDPLVLDARAARQRRTGEDAKQGSWPEQQRKRSQKTAIRSRRCFRTQKSITNVFMLLRICITTQRM